MTTSRQAYAISPDRPGSDLAGETAAAMAAASIAFRSSNPSYADELLFHARQVRIPSRTESRRNLVDGVQSLYFGHLQQLIAWPDVVSPLKIFGASQWNLAMNLQNSSLSLLWVASSLHASVCVCVCCGSYSHLLIHIVGSTIAASR